MTQPNSKRNSSLYARVIRLVTTWQAGAVAAVVVVAAVLLLWPLSAGKTDGRNQPTARVERGPLTISISESGAVKSREQIILKSQVEGRTTILSLIPEGTKVKAGDLLLELDTSTLEEQKISQQITLLNAEAAFVRARENREVVKSQAASDVAKADLALRFAKLDLDKYLQGEFPQQLQKAESNITLAMEYLTSANKKLTWSQQLAAEGYITRTELQSDELAQKRANLDLAQAEMQLKLLKEYTYTREDARLKSDLEQTKSALERAKRKALSDVTQAEADFTARESEHARQKSKLEKMIDQIAKCKMKAPVDGMVVYATTASGDRRGNQQPLAEGQDIRERQELIYLPTATAMKAEIKVQESSLRKVAIGMPARVTVDAIPGSAFQGTVAKIGLLPDAQSQWLNPDLTVYATEINLEGDMSELRPGMSCRAEIIVERYEDALFVPVQAVTRVAGKPTVYVQTSSGFEPRAIETGLDNNRVIRVISGLKEGEPVSLTPPLEAASLGAQGEGGASGEPLPPRAAGISSSDSALPAKAPGAQQDPGAFDAEKFRSMSSEERRAAMANMTDEQRAAMRAQFGGRRGGPRGVGEGSMQGGEGDEAGSTDSTLGRGRFRMGGSTDSHLGRPRSRDEGAGGRAAGGSGSSEEGAARD